MWRVHRECSATAPRCVSCAGREDMRRASIVPRVARVPGASDISDVMDGDHKRIDSETGKKRQGQPPKPRADGNHLINIR